MKTSASIKQLETALIEVNKQFDNNIKFKDIKQLNSKKVQFTLTVKDSNKPGSRRNADGKRISAACWHVHGEFFDILWNNDPDTIIYTGNVKMESKADNWQDRNIGSTYNPLIHSEACNC